MHRQDPNCRVITKVTRNECSEGDSEAPCRSSDKNPFDSGMGGRGPVSISISRPASSTSLSSSLTALDGSEISTLFSITSMPDGADNDTHLPASSTNSITISSLQPNEKTLSTSPPGIPTSDSNPQIGSSSHTNRKITGAIAGGIVGGFSFITLMAFLLWRKKRRSGGPLRNFLFINNNETTNGKKVDERLIPYDLKHVSVHIENSIPHPQPNSTSEPTSTTEVPPNSEKYTPSLSEQLTGRNQSPFSLEMVSSNQDKPASESGHHNAIHTRSRAFSESCLTRVPSITSQSTLTARQQIIRSEAEDLRMQLQAIQQAQAAAQQAAMLSNDEMKNTLAVMMAHIQRLDRQFDSDWARGLTDEAPPEYYDARR